MKQQIKSENLLDRTRIPCHVAIIMDGNGRWAKKRGLPRVAGHHAGVKTVDAIVEAATELGIKVLTLYTFSSENWTRPRLEINTLMELLHRNLISRREKLKKNGVQLRICGDISGFPDMVKNELLLSVKETAPCQNMILNLALGYSGRDEIIDACRRFAMEYKNNEITLEDITKERFGSYLFTGNLPDPDLIIRTSGEYRLSNFLLWQCSYAEFYFTEILWPNFTRDNLIEALVDYQRRERRFGGVSDKDHSQ